VNKSAKLEARESLRSLLSKSTGTIYTSWHKTTNQGMSRYISVYLIVDQPNYGTMLTNITGYCCTLYGYRLSKDGQLIIGGCGYDVGYHIADNLKSDFTIDNFGHSWI